VSPRRPKASPKPAKFDLVISLKTTWALDRAIIPTLPHPAIQTMEQGGGAFARFHIDKNCRNSISGTAARGWYSDTDSCINNAFTTCHPRTPKKRLRASLF
jgi:hypothetical protein